MKHSRVSGTYAETQPYSVLNGVVFGKSYAGLQGNTRRKHTSSKVLAVSKTARAEDFDDETRQKIVNALARDNQ